MRQPHSTYSARELATLLGYSSVGSLTAARCRGLDDALPLPLYVQTCRVVQPYWERDAVDRQVERLGLHAGMDKRRMGRNIADGWHAVPGCWGVLACVRSGEVVAVDLPDHLQTYAQREPIEDALRLLCGRRVWIDWSQCSEGVRPVRRWADAGRDAL
jgi:hypothetical protein